MPMSPNVKHNVHIFGTQFLKLARRLNIQDHSPMNIDIDYAQAQESESDTKDLRSMFTGDFFVLVFAIEHDTFSYFFWSRLPTKFEILRCSEIIINSKPCFLNSEFRY